MPQRHIPFRTTATAAVVAALLLLSGCGSSHHSDPTGPTSETTPAATPPTPGTYRGPLTLTASAGGQSATDSAPIVIVLGADGTVRVGQFPPTKLQGNSFTTTAPATALNQLEPTLQCTKGSFGINGTFAGQAVAGNFFSNGIVCSGVAVSLTGNYTAQLSASELPRSGSGDDVLHQTGRLLKQVIH